MSGVRKQFSKEFKAKVALEAIKGLKTTAEISSEYSVHSSQIAKWKKELREGLPELFAGKKSQQEKDKDHLIEELYKQIGQTQVENDWLKKKTAILDHDTRKQMLDKDDKKISMRKQCDLLGISRSGLYYQKRPENPYNMELMNLIDEEFTRHPFMGVKAMTTHLRKDKGKHCGPKRVRRLMRKMGLMAVYPKRKTSIPNKEHEVYPYLLRDVTIDRPNQVWATDITYIRLRHGFAYLVAIMDWHSRSVLSWRLSNTMDSSFCCEALDEALKLYGAPEVFNSDQGSQFTSEAFISRLKAKHISISMDGRGRVFDNIFVERLWRTVKYQDIYIKGYETMQEVQEGLTKYFHYYNHERRHQSLRELRPWDVYEGIDQAAA
ncbi:MAG: IS3 family transposase [Candidatus Auribacterota bacterium]|nr:IS3 family transposase [Candidatus Auribacterota bacterium]